jgi:hypothetical protein
MKLEETQALFYGLVTRSSPALVGRVGACFVGSPQLPATERVDIYANMYLWRQVDALRQDFPKLAAVLGDEGFYAICEAYVREHPSEHHDLGHLGRHLAEFVRASPDLERPDLGDLAALEWARAEVFFEAPVKPIGRDALASLDAEEFASARVELVPALRILKLDYDVVGLWRQLEDGAKPESPEPKRSVLAVWRPTFEVFHTALEPDEALALERAATGAPLAEVCSAFEGREAPAEAAFAAIASWLDEGWVATIRTCDQPARSEHLEGGRE